MASQRSAHSGTEHGHIDASPGKDYARRNSEQVELRDVIGLPSPAEVCLYSRACSPPVRAATMPRALCPLRRASR